jgi:hypothetical protein
MFKSSRRPRKRAACPAQGLRDSSDRLGLHPSEQPPSESGSHRPCPTRLASGILGFNYLVSCMGSLSLGILSTAGNYLKKYRQNFHSWIHERPMTRLQAIRLKPKRTTLLKVAVVLAANLTALLVWLYMLWMLNWPKPPNAFGAFGRAYFFCAGMIAWNMVIDPTLYPKEQSGRSRFFIQAVMGLLMGLGALIQDGVGWHYFAAGATGGFFGMIHGRHVAQTLIDRWGLVGEASETSPLAS